LAYFYFFYFQVLQLKSKYRVFWARAVELLQMPEYIEQPCSRQHDREVWTIKQCWAYSELDTAAFRVLGKYRMSTSSRSCSRPRYTQHGARLPTARRNVPRDRLSTHRTMVLGKLALEKKFPVAENWLQRLAWRSKLAWSYLSWQPMLWFARSDSSRQFHALYNLPNILFMDHLSASSYSRVTVPFYGPGLPGIFGVSEWVWFSQLYCIFLMYRYSEWKWIKKMHRLCFTVTIGFEGTVYSIFFEKNTKQWLTTAFATRSCTTSTLLKPLASGATD